MRYIRGTGSRKELINDEYQNMSVVMIVKFITWHREKIMWYGTEISLVDWSIGQVVECLVCWLVGCLVGWLIDLVPKYLSGIFLEIMIMLAILSEKSRTPLLAAQNYHFSQNCLPFLNFVHYPSKWNKIIMKRDKLSCYNEVLPLCLLIGKLFRIVCICKNFVKVFVDELCCVIGKCIVWKNKSEACWKNERRQKLIQ